MAQQMNSLQRTVDLLPQFVEELNKLREAVTFGDALIENDEDDQRRNRSSRYPVYLLEWRMSRGKRLDEVADACGLSKSQISRVENGLQTYTQRILEGYADCLDCLPSDLISHPPTDPDKAMRPLLLQMAKLPQEDLPRWARVRSKDRPLQQAEADVKITRAASGRDRPNQ